MMWGLTALVVLTTFAISFGTKDGYSQKETPKSQNNSPFGDLSKYSVVDFNASDSANATEREERVIKNKRYDKKLFIAKNPDSQEFAWIVSDVETAPPVIPYAESRLIVIGNIQNSKVFLSNEKAGVYSEYSVCIEAILKEDSRKKRTVGEIITTDRAGGIVRYPNGHQMLYRIDWQDLPEVGGRYLLFLSNDDEKTRILVS